MITFHLRRFHMHINTLSKNAPLKLKGKSQSSQEWLRRQISDPYVEKAKIMNYRCRSAFKLLEIDDKHHILVPGYVVIDCGAAPGSWSQIAAKRTNSDGELRFKPQGTVISLDLLQIHPIKGVTCLGGIDFTQLSTHEKLKHILEEKKVNSVLSDMAPNATGIRMLDQENIMNLCYSVLKFSINISTKGGNLLVKVWDNADVCKLEKDISRFYDYVKRVKPKASRSDSAENFILAKGFKGIN